MGHLVADVLIGVLLAEVLLDEEVGAAAELKRVRAEVDKDEVPLRAEGCDQDDATNGRCRAHERSVRVRLAAPLALDACPTSITWGPGLVSIRVT